MADIVAQDGVTAEIESAASGGWVTDGMTVGLLTRRHVMPVYSLSIGKESNRLEAVERGEVRSLDEVQEIMENPKQTFWGSICIPLLNAVPAEESEAESGIAESLLIGSRKGAVKPGPANLKRLIGALRGKLVGSDGGGLRAERCPDLPMGIGRGTGASSFRRHIRWRRPGRRP